MPLRVLGVVALATAVSAACAPPAPPEAPPAQLAPAPAPAPAPPWTGPAPTVPVPLGMLADSGFRPTLDGFSFANYGNPSGVVNLRTEELVQLFGDDVCIDGTGGQTGVDCRLTSPAVAWLDQINGMMAGGHCEGFAVASQVFRTGTDTPTRFGANRTFDLSFDGNAALQGTIARWFATQATSPAGDAREDDMTPTEVVTALTAAFKEPLTADNAYTIAFFKRGFAGGHAVTPYAVEDRGNGISAILIYDNNFPGDTRAIEVDTKTDTWKYHASTSPDVPGSLYEGDASSKTLMIAALTPRLGQQACPFCAGELDDEMSAKNQFSLTGDGSTLKGTDFYITDSQHRVFGRRGGQLVTQFDDARVVPLVTRASNDPAPLLEASAALGVDAVIAAGDEDAEDMRFALIGAGYDVVVDGLTLPAGTSDRVTLSTDGSSVGYHSHTTNTPWIEVATGYTDPDSDDEYNYDIRVRATDLASAGSLIITSPEDSANVLFGANRAGTFAVEVVQIAPDGTERVVSSDSIELDAYEQVQLDLDGWIDPVAPLHVTVLDSDGDPDATRELELS